MLALVIGWLWRGLIVRQRHRCGLLLHLLPHRSYFYAGDGLDGVVCHSVPLTAGMGRRADLYAWQHGAGADLDDHPDHRVYRYLVL